MNKFWTSFGAICGPQTDPKIHPKTGPELNQKVVKKGDAPKMAQSQPLGSNLLSLAHSKESFRRVKPYYVRKRAPFQPLAEGKAETGELGCSGLLWLTSGCNGLLEAALCYSALLWAALACSRLLWAALGCSRLLSDALVCFGLLWAALGCFGLLWAA